MPLDIFGGSLDIFGVLKVSNDGTVTTIMGPSGDYNRIGDAGTTSHSLNSEDDVMVTGELEIKGTLFYDGNMTGGDNTSLSVGTGRDFQRRYSTYDANAFLCHEIAYLGGDGNNVPVWVYGDISLENLDLGGAGIDFSGRTETLLAPIDADADSYVGFGFTSDDVGIVTGGGSLTRIDFDQMGMLNYNAAAVKTIDGSGIVAVTQTYHSIVVTGGPGSGDDDLSSATGGSEGDILILKANASGSTNIVTVKNGTGSNTFILAGADFVLDHIDDRIMLIHNGTEWVELSRSANS